MEGKPQKEEKEMFAESFLFLPKPYFCCYPSMVKDRKNIFYRISNRYDDATAGWYDYSTVM